MNSRLDAPSLSLPRSVLLDRTLLEVEHEQDDDVLSILDEEIHNSLNASSMAYAHVQWQLVTDLARRLAYFLHVRSYIAEWVAHAGQAVAAASQSGEPRKLAGALNHRGTVLRQANRFAKAMEYCQQSKELHQACGDDSGAALLEGNLGSIDFATGYAGSSLEHYRQASEKLGALVRPYEKAKALMGSRSCLVQLGRLEDASAVLEACLCLPHELGDPFGESQTLNNLGLLERRRGNLMLATTYLLGGLQLKRALGARQGSAHSLNNLAAVYRDMGALARAEQAWQEALNLLTGVARTVWVVLPGAQWICVVACRVRLQLRDPSLEGGDVIH